MSSSGATNKEQPVITHLTMDFTRSNAVITSESNGVEDEEESKEEKRLSWTAVA